MSRHSAFKRSIQQYTSKYSAFKQPTAKRFKLKRLLPSVLLTTSCLLGPAASLGLSGSSRMVQAQTLTEEGVPEDAAAGDSFYTFYDQRIALIERNDQIAVQFDPDPVTTRGGAAEPAYLQLQRDLRAEADEPSTRGGAPAAQEVEVSPLGEQYALITAPEGQSIESQIMERLEKSYINATLPVMSREAQEDSIVVTPEIVVSFEPGTSESEARALLSRNNLTLIRQLQFSRGRYLVSAPNAAGLQVLAVANQLTTMPSIQSATPNFVQSLPYQITPLDILRVNGGQGAEGSAEGEAQEDSENSIEGADSVQNTPFAGSLLPLQWYLNSESRRPTSPRTDIRALEAWEKGTDGEGVSVAVIDSLIQWDHPDLLGNLYTLPETAEDGLPGEVSGWDFSNTEVTCDAETFYDCAVGDPDTRISEQEIALVKPDFQNSIALPNAELLAAYPDLNELLQIFLPALDEQERADFIRDLIQGSIASEFHGTWTAGVIAANPLANPEGASAEGGMVGVAPNAKILPVRVFGLGGSITAASLIEAVGYAAARNVDVVNFSLGGLLPSQEFTDQIFDVIDDNPNLVIVASAGNDSVDGVSFPAAIPGVLSVGATGIDGNRTFYSSYGAGLDVVGPGGETTEQIDDGILTAGGTWVDGFWEGINPPADAWGPTLDPLGQYVQVQGTSFSAPAISGVMALMKGADPNRQLSRDQLIEILRSAADYEELKITQADANEYRLQAAVGFNTIAVPGFPKSRPSGIQQSVEPVSAEEYFFGSGLVDAAIAVDSVQQAVD